MSKKADLLEKLSSYYRPEVRRTWFPEPVAEARRERGLSLELQEEGEEIDDELRRLQERYTPITVLCRHLYSHEAEIVEDRAREVMRAVMAQHEEYSDAEAIRVVDDLITDFLILRQQQPGELPDANAKPDPEYLARFKGLWEVSLGYSAMRFFDNERDVLVNAYLIAKGKHEDQVYVTDEEVELTEEEEARFAPDETLDPDDQEALDKEKQEVIEQHKSKIRTEYLLACSDARKEAEAFDVDELKAIIGRKCGVQKALEEAQNERQIQRLYFVIRDPETKAKEKVGDGRLDGYARFFSKVSPHPLLRKGGAAKPDFSDARYVSQDPGLHDFWQFLVDLDSEMLLCKTQEDVERLANSRPFRDDGAAAGALGDRSLGELADAVLTGRGSLDTPVEDTSEADSGGHKSRRSGRRTKAKQADSQVD